MIANWGDFDLPDAVRYRWHWFRDVMASPNEEPEGIGWAILVIGFVFVGLAVWGLLHS